MKNILDFTKNYLLSEFVISMHQTSGVTFTNPVHEVTFGKDSVVYNYTGAFPPGLKHLSIDARYVNNTVIFSLNMEKDVDDIGALYSFLPEGAITIKFSENASADAILASGHYGPWWMEPHFTESFDKLPPKTQNIVLQKGDLHYHLLPLCGNDFRCEFDKNGLFISPGTSGLQCMNGDFLAVTAADDPFTAVKLGYENAHAAGSIRVPLIKDRKFPKLFEGFGWCTWDSFYHDVTSEKIYKKLDEFKEKNIPVKWMIIDDGWSCVNGKFLTSFKEDSAKFPEGLKACIAKIKSNYGVEKVGVWHNYLGYWLGVEKDSELYELQKENLVHTPSGIIMPAIDEERAFRFWDTWHSYLADCGVDFLKIDNQSSFSHRASGIMPTAEAARISHKAIDRSVIKNFDGVMINCMGMDMENVLARPVTALSRNSDDFFPLREHGFTSHIMQNVYNAIWHSQLYFCDYDMWWSKHEAAVQSGVLRSISGSPIYVSDAMGETDASAIFPTIENDGTVMRCDYAARPTLDCFYTDCRTSGTLLKTWNRSDNAFAATLFNISDNKITDRFDIGSIPEIDKESSYIAYDYFGKTFAKVKAGDNFTVTLDPDGVAVYNLYPVFVENGEEFVLLGSTDKYVPIASKNKVKRFVSELL